MISSDNQYPMYALLYVVLAQATIILGAFHALIIPHTNFSTWDSVFKHAPQAQLNKAISVWYAVVGAKIAVVKMTRALLVQRISSVYKGHALEVARVPSHLNCLINVFPQLFLYLHSFHTSRKETIISATCSHSQLLQY